MGSSRGRRASADGAARRAGGGGSAGQRPQQAPQRAPEPQLGAPRRSADALDAVLLDEIGAINAAGVELLVQRAAEAVAPGTPPVGDAGAGIAAGSGVLLPPGPLPQAWLALDAAQRRRLAAQPFLLFGIGFEDGARWRVLADDVLAADSPRRIAESRPRTVPVIYARLLVHYAWHLARTAPLTAGLVAGMAGTSAAALRACHVEHLDALAERAAPWLQPRWMDAPTLWNDLLRAARTEGAAGLARSAALHAVQRAGAALAAGAGAETEIAVRAAAGGVKMSTPL
jgi:hypothetical protein